MLIIQVCHKRNLPCQMSYVMSYVVCTHACKHAIPYHTIPYHTIPYHTIPDHTMPYHTMPCHTIQCHAVPCHPVPRRAMSCQCECGAVQRDATQCGIAQKLALDHHTSLHNIMLCKVSSCFSLLSRHTSHNDSPIASHTHRGAINHRRTEHGATTKPTSLDLTNVMSICQG